MELKSDFELICERYRKERIVFEHVHDYKGEDNIMEYGVIIFIISVFILDMQNVFIRFKPGVVVVSSVLR